MFNQLSWHRNRVTPENAQKYSDMDDVSKCHEMDGTHDVPKCHEMDGTQRARYFSEYQDLDDVPKCHEMDGTQRARYFSEYQDLDDVPKCHEVDGTQRPCERPSPTPVELEAGSHALASSRNAFHHGRSARDEFQHTPGPHLSETYHAYGQHPSNRISFPPQSYGVAPHTTSNVKKSRIYADHSQRTSLPSCPLVISPTSHYWTDQGQSAINTPERHTFMPNDGPQLFSGDTFHNHQITRNFPMTSVDLSSENRQSYPSHLSKESNLYNLYESPLSSFPSIPYYGTPGITGKPSMQHWMDHSALDMPNTAVLGGPSSLVTRHHLQGFTGPKVVTGHGPLAHPTIWNRGGDLTQVNLDLDPGKFSFCSNGYESAPPPFNPRSETETDMTVSTLPRTAVTVNTKWERPESQRTKPRRSSNVNSTSLLQVSCDDCTEVFNGIYRKGNLRRHIRHMHSTASTDLTEFPCRCPPCTKTYKRADARKKHEWKKHQQGGRPEKRDGANAMVSPRPIRQDEHPASDSHVSFTPDTVSPSSLSDW